jgi:hypothetical protein
VRAIKGSQVATTNIEGPLSQLLAKETYRMRLFTSAVCTTVAIGLLAGCAGNMGSSNASPPAFGPQVRTRPISVYDDVAPPRSVAVLHSLVLPTKAMPKAGIYVSQFFDSNVLGYPAVNKGNKKPICTIQGVASVNDLGIDGKGNLMEPDGGSATLFIYKGPSMCGKQLGSISDTFGQPSDASSPNAATGKIALGNLESGTLPGNLAICTLKGGCATDLTNPAIYHVGGVAMSNAGDCWLNAKTSVSGGAALLFFKGCAGAGVVAKGFKSTYYGGIDIDNSGNLVIIDDMAMTTTIYKGCNPKCKVVGGPFPLKGESFFGKLNATNSEYIVVGRTDAVVDVYTYSTKSIKFEYSFNNGLAVSLEPDGVAVNPRSKQ